VSEQKIIHYLPCYSHLLLSDADVNLLYGGRDSGKSYFIAQKLIADCMRNDYFRCILVKKTHESIKDAQWQTIKDIVEQEGLAHLFTFYRAPLEIHYNNNGNKFIARGCDNPAKMKSIKDPSTVWIEEANQLGQEDYLTISTTLRSNKARIEEWLSFNPETKGDYREHWIYKDFLSMLDNPCATGNYTKHITANDRDYTLNYSVTHTTYEDNPYCKPEQVARHEHLLEVNPHRYKIYTKGLWGNEDNSNPWAWALNRDKHYNSELFTPNKNYNLDLSFDFNFSPCTVVVAQDEQHLPRYNIIGYHKASSSHESALKQLCDRIRTEYPHHYRTKQITITGDASGTQRDPSRPSNINRYTDICGYLGVGIGAVRIERANLPHKSSRDLCNDILHQIPKGGYVFWGGRGCEMLLSEIESAYPDDKESLNKAKKELGLHGLDAWRYLNGMYFAYHLKGARFKEYQRMIDAVVMRLKTHQHV